MTLKTVVVSLGLSLQLLGCATQKKSLALGAALGTGAGGLIGSSFDPGEAGQKHRYNMVLGSALGALAGSAIGFLYHESQSQTGAGVESSSQGTRGVGGESKAFQSVPPLEPAKVKVRFVDDQVKNGTHIPAHFEFDIAEPAKWKGQDEDSE